MTRGGARIGAGRRPGSRNRIGREAKERLAAYLRPNEASAFKRLFASKDDKVLLETLRLCLLYTEGRPREAVSVSVGVGLEGVLEELARRRLQTTTTTPQLLPAAEEEREP